MSYLHNRCTDFSKMEGKYLKTPFTSHFLLETRKLFPHLIIQQNWWMNKFVASLIAPLPPARHFHLMRNIWWVGKWSFPSTWVPFDAMWGPRLSAWWATHLQILLFADLNVPERHAPDVTTVTEICPSTFCLLLSTSPPAYFSPPSLPTSVPHPYFAALNKLVLIR